MLLGVAGLAIGGQRQTPLGLVQGIDINAQLIEAMQHQELLRRPWYFDWIELALTLAAGVGGDLAVALRPAGASGRSPPSAAAAVLIGIEAAAFGFAGLLFDGSYPAFTMLAAFGVMLVGTLARRGSRSRPRARGKAALRGGAGGRAGDPDGAAAAPLSRLSASGRKSTSMPASSRRGSSAAISTITLLIDNERRLFFLIADVSGKGAPAALLMVSTKEVIREAVLRHGVALDRVLDEANHKTVSASTELQSEGGVFVTAFAGILDLGTGAVAYASAGHEAPFSSAEVGLAPADDRRGAASRGDRGLSLSASTGTGSSRAKFCCSTPMA